MSKTDSLIKSTTLSYKENLLFYEKVFASIPAAVFIIDIHQNTIIWSNENFRQSSFSENLFSAEFLLDGLNLSQGRQLGLTLREHFSLHPSKVFTTAMDMTGENEKPFTVCLTCKIFRKTSTVFEVVCTAMEASPKRQPVTSSHGPTAAKIVENSYHIIGTLSKRELQLAKFFAQGHPTKVIAEHFNLSVHTINNHRKNVLRKLGCRNIASFVYFAMKNGLN
jgi:DNA-binding CsgD family transcriptional regulator